MNEIDDLSFLASIDWSDSKFVDRELYMSPFPLMKEAKFQLKYENDEFSRSLFDSPTCISNLDVFGSDISEHSDSSLSFDCLDHEDHSLPPPAFCNFQQAKPKNPLPRSTKEVEFAKVARVKVNEFITSSILEARERVQVLLPRMSDVPNPLVYQAEVKNTKDRPGIASRKRCKNSLNRPVNNESHRSKKAKTYPMSSAVDFDVCLAKGGDLYVTIKDQFSTHVVQCNANELYNICNISSKVSSRFPKYDDVWIDSLFTEGNFKQLSELVSIILSDEEAQNTNIFKKVFLMPGTRSCLPNSSFIDVLGLVQKKLENVEKFAPNFESLPEFANISDNVLKAKSH
mmetsp:Transcript_10793/g.14006  ORF Transcript_10793/g.14006 Transcript_10793/m.14006 type:complete len:343 (+) Transcript_10793:190-1218(+)|eukprot:CAMPEP_0117751512 /NCGR_PEP_ID=MMETSP0947-20121206/11021_1 /TAXON_ID=44440 /ORGANISM="Chattonella subsalsa, Strain CCMP2191" /LENGTH=342 /DNA_ID=CAMNT_0005569911 /DNA_START=147 /DNA_END=1175 /DNA_ORIENTATION=+